MMMAYDLDHIGKRFRVRIKTEGNIWIFDVQFTKIDLVQLMGNSRQFAEVDIDSLFNPKDLMDVGEMVKCLDAIKKLGSVPFRTFLQQWRNEPGNHSVHKEMLILGAVAGSMRAIIVGDEEPTGER